MGSGFSCDARHQRDDAGQDRADTPRARSTTHLSLPLPEAPQEMRAQPPNAMQKRPDTDTVKKN